MPELPEVECLARSIAAETSGFEFTDVRFFRADLRDPMPFDAIRGALVGETPARVRRRSKYLLIETRQGAVILHLGMSGQLLALNTPEPVKPHTHVIFELRGKRNVTRKYLHFVDPRRFGRLTAVPSSFDLTAHPWLESLGPEPLDITEEQLADHLFAASRKRKTAVKPFIMDGSVLVGVGNIYASESLYLAGVRPGRAAGRVSRAEYGQIAAGIQSVLKAAIAAGGTTFRDYLHSDGSEGSYGLRLNVYGRSGESCQKCFDPVREMRQSNRSTYFCGTCQK